MRPIVIFAVVLRALNVPTVVVLVLKVREALLKRFVSLSGATVNVAVKMARRAMDMTLHRLKIGDIKKKDK